jgi:hypothetical protein
MKRIILLFLLAVLSGCAGTSPAAAVATSMNAVLPGLVEAYRQEGLAAVAAAPDRATAEAKLVEIEAKWRPVWTAWDAMAASQSIEAMTLGYCSLMQAWPLEHKPVQVIDCG